MGTFVVKRKAFYLMLDLSGDGAARGYSIEVLRTLQEDDFVRAEPQPGINRPPDLINDAPNRGNSLPRGVARQLSGT